VQGILKSKLKAALESALTKNLSVYQLQAEMKAFQGNLDIVLQKAIKDNDVICNI
jgi:hypothetical protein